MESFFKEKVRRFWYSEKELNRCLNHSRLYHMRKIEGKLFTSWTDLDEKHPEKDAILVFEGSGEIEVYNTASGKYE